jgi:hypothetical protein
MSVVYTFNNGWILCHEDFIRKLYDNITGSTFKKLAFNSCFFKINTPFARTQSNSSSDSMESNTLNTTRKRRKNRKCITPDMTNVSSIRRSNHY